jgi:hypothetical protein
MSEAERFSPEEFEVLLHAWPLHARNGAIIPEPEKLPACHHLAERGWLERRFHDDGDMSFRWTRQAEAALDINSLTETAMESVN